MPRLATNAKKLTKYVTTKNLNKNINATKIKPTKATKASENMKSSSIRPATSNYAIKLKKMIRKKRDKSPTRFAKKIMSNFESICKLN